MLKSVLKMAIVLLTAHAALADSALVEELNKGLGTCQSKTQKQNAAKALKFFDYVKSWDTKSQVEAMADNFVLWNASRAFAYANTPEAGKSGLIFGTGQATKAQYGEYVARTRYAYDFSQYVILPTRVDCIGESAVAASTQFIGLAVRRDEKGYIRYAVEVNTPVRQMFVFNSEGLIELQLTDLDDSVTAKLGKDFAALLATGKPNVELSEATRGTLPELLKAEEEKLK